ncbi:hypothetical protein [Limisphaera sp. VF-2]|uniref:hypothetical protein n=1 Tax=Limisphaera sp. VF-2 TaxID=3400418 RepID=UPI001765C0E5
MTRAGVYVIGSATRDVKRGAVLAWTRQIDPWTPPGWQEPGGVTGLLLTGLWDSQSNVLDEV